MNQLHHRMRPKKCISLLQTLTYLPKTNFPCRCTIDLTDIRASLVIELFSNIENRVNKLIEMLVHIYQDIMYYIRLIYANYYYY